ncbi:hypothetical protein ACFQX7_08355 [Luedemannella flava]
MGSAKARPSHRAQRRRVVASTIQSGAAACLGLLISIGLVGALADVAYHRMILPDWGIGGVTPLVVVIVALLATAPRWAAVRWLIGERCGWPLATAGALIAVTTTAVAGDQPGAGRAMLAVAGAVALGGVLLAAGEATGLLRLAIVTGLAAGIAAAPLAFAYGFVTVGFGSLAEVPGVVLFGILVVAAIAATIADLVDPRADVTRTPRLGLGRTVAPAAVTMLAIAIPVVAAKAGAIVVDKLLAGGTASEKRTSLAATVELVLPFASAAAALVVLTWYAHRRAGAPLVRFVLTATGLGVILPVGLQTDLLAHRSGGAVIVFAGTVAALTGVLLAYRAPRFLPWDAVGLLIGGGGLVLLGRMFRSEVHSPAPCSHCSSSAAPRWRWARP